jgi:hypothetical protein
MIAVSFALEALYPMIYNEYRNDLGNCMLFTIDDRPVNDMNSIIKYNKIRELQQQNPAALEDMKQECLSKYPPLPANLAFVLGLMSLILVLAGIVLITVAIMMIKNDRKEERRRRREEYNNKITSSQQKEQEEKETKDKEF